MKAVRIHTYGGRDVLTYEDAPMPEIGDNDVLIRVHAAAVCPFDWKVRQGYLAGWMDFNMPLILGWDVSGVVTEIGSQVNNFSVGDEVFALADVSRNGGYAEYISVPAAKVVAKPKTIDHVETAAIPNSGLAAWQALINTANLRAGQTVLVHAAAGGVGTFAVQIAKWRGATVIGTASPNNHDFLTQLGADQVIDYNTTRFEDMVHDVDVVLDDVGGDTQERSYAVLKPGGILISIVQPPDEEKAAAAGVRTAFVAADNSNGTLNQIAELVDLGSVCPVVTAIFPLSEAAQAHALSESMHTRGKIVLQVA